MTALELSRVSKSFGGRQVFKDISLSFSGGALAVFGPNGSGKTTILRIIAGLCPPTSGSVSVLEGGKPVDGDRRRSIMGFVSPDISLYDELTVIENLRFFASVRGISAGCYELYNAVEFFGLNSHSHLRFGELSSGMKQRAKLASAVLHNPSILLLDEPYSNMDDSGLQIVQSLIEERRKNSIVVIAASAASDVASADFTLRLGE